MNIYLEIISLKLNTNKHRSTNLLYIFHYLKQAANYKMLLLVVFALSFHNLFTELKGSAIIDEKWKEKRFKIYWNIPTFQCDYFKLNFTGLAAKYNIIQNNNDRFRGEAITILYDPGSFPAILKQGSNTYLRNGGIPQQGNLTYHLQIFEDLVNQLIVKDFDGIGIIDFESWRPIFRQNFGVLLPYKDLSIKLEKSRHPDWSNALLKKEAARRFESSGRTFVEDTLRFIKLLRPNGSWGYYAYPYCFNMNPNNMVKNCPKNVVEENDRVDWLFKVVDVLFPSLYLSDLRLNTEEKLEMIEGRVEEALRISKKFSNKKVLPYFWYKYQDTKEFLSKTDLFNSFVSLSSYDINGLVLWGSSNDVNSKEKCFELYNYINDILGPLLVNLFY